ncbi:hypothetical protein DPMN_058062 [Dreissena polymorpha]|uniref:Uncharacterized protein n=1 Tax=Dreissena polymorpha TaxID=45954 RepID=A0A9D4HD12_DREPO|nr:hypothetical protein DPMN_058062 [Dreissena polymorpha]
MQIIRSHTVALHLDGRLLLYRCSSYVFCVYFPGLRDPGTDTALFQNAGLLQRIDSDVASKIKELVVEEVVANVEEMQCHLTSFVMKNVTPAPSRTKRRFAPTKK